MRYTLQRQEKQAMPQMVLRNEQFVNWQSESGRKTTLAIGAFFPYIQYGVGK